MNKIDPTYVEVLKLDKNNLRELPPSLEKFVNLKELDLSNNSLLTVPPYITSFKKLLSFKIDKKQE
jgi:Leucine-rich repeat (LRR) protein